MGDPGRGPTSAADGGPGEDYLPGGETEKPVGAMSSTNIVVEMLGRNPIVHQAPGMIAVQLQCDIIQAATQLVEHARITNQELPQAAQDVIARRKHFS
jgi:hypothetical protein